jgi:putative membrane protein
MTEDPIRKPRVFQLDDTRLEQFPPAIEDAEPSYTPAQSFQQGIRWTKLLVAALGGLISLSISIWIWDFVTGLFARGGLLGTFALLLAGLFALACLMLAIREILGFFRLAHVTAIRARAETALLGDKKKLAETISFDIEKLFTHRKEAVWAIHALKEHRSEVLDAGELLILTERELMTPLDEQARTIISGSMKRVAMITAVSPSAILDVTVVAYENLTMMRKLATLYGGRPGGLGALRLARLVAGHLTLTGGMAIGDDFLQQILGHGLTARLSAKLGEGILNGAFTGRVGIAAIELCRPLPFIEATRPRLRDFVGQLRNLQRGNDTSSQA